MGFASYHEDICDRYYESSSLFADWSTYVGPRPAKRDVEEARDVLGDPLQRPRRIIHDFWRYYKHHKPMSEAPSGYWERHYSNLDRLHSTLAGVAALEETTPEAWEVLTRVEADLRQFFLEAAVYGPLSPQVLERVMATSREIRSRCVAVENELRDFVSHVRKLPPGAGGEEIREALTKLKEIREQLEADLNTRRRYDERARQVRQWGSHFLKLYAHLAVQSRYRPTLQQLHRLRLNEQQESLVALNHGKAYRIQGASGSGKTIILIHRALRLALENPSSVVRLFTINRSLAELLRDSIAAVHGSVPANLHVAAFYDFLIGVLGMFEDASRYRLVDDRSGERIVISWQDFFRHKGRDEGQNVFAEGHVRSLVESIEGRQRLRIDACRYLRDEMTYIQSAYRAGDRPQYLIDPRAGRSVVLQEGQRKASLRVLDAWEGWLRWGDMCDVDGLTVRVADWFARADSLDRIRREFPTAFVLADEVQDFSTLELDILRRLVTDPDGQNRFFLVGDLNQKVFPKQHNTARAGFDFTGRGKILRQNYRNTKQILNAAYCIPKEFPPQADEPLEVADPELSPYEGGEPVALACTASNHIERVLDLVRRRRGSRVAVVSENLVLLDAVRAEAIRLGLKCYELFRVEDLDLWKQQQVEVLAADVVVSRLEAVKGFEFDTLIACDLSEGVVPQPGTPPDEYWREAAVVYSALTRARDELVLTYVGQPSIFLKAMGGYVAMHEPVDVLQFT